MRIGRARFGYRRRQVEVPARHPGERSHRQEGNEPWRMNITVRLKTIINVQQKFFGTTTFSVPAEILVGSLWARQKINNFHRIANGRTWGGCLSFSGSLLRRKYYSFRSWFIANEFCDSLLGQSQGTRLKNIRYPRTELRDRCKCFCQQVASKAFLLHDYFLFDFNVYSIRCASDRLFEAVKWQHEWTNIADDTGSSCTKSSLSHLFKRRFELS